MPHKPDTNAITSGRDQSRSLSPAVWASTVWETDSLEDAKKRATGLRSGAFYSRFANPTVTQFEDAISQLEGAESALAFGSGMGAVASVILSLCGNGSHIVAQNNLYGATLSFLQGPCARFGIETTFVDPTVPGSFAAAVIPGKTMLVIAETPSNPRLAITNLSELGAIRGPFTIVDSTLATPMGQRPLDFGVDIVLHSATKGIGGHNDALLGVIAGEKDLIDSVWNYAVMHGAVASPYDAANGLRGIRTLGVRTERQNQSALILARSLEGHSKVLSVSHPFLESHPQHSLARDQMRHGGTVIAVELSGGQSACQSLVAQLQLVRIATSFGGPETLVCHPASSTHVGLSPEALATMGVTDGLLRFSIGLEDADDLVDDIHRALATQ
ncbi:MAG: PLP-dependent transferase [Actinobacteria bacterium]|nr:PLP-dependent transferase [Actinomycetota bacterium]MTB13014.1 PLP-dependent transferase [Actinomycetota bacterium]